MTPERGLENGTMKYKSVIDDDLWDQAHWVATAFSFLPIEGGIPAMALAFEHEGPAVKIFQQWHSSFGNEDTDERVRIAIIEGEIPGQADGYTVHLTTNPTYLATRIDRSPGDNEQRYIATLCRFNRMRISQGLKGFKTALRRFRKYLILPAIFNQHISPELRPLPKLAILKREIYFRHVHEIGSSDLDVSVLAASRQ